MISRFLLQDEELELTTSQPAPVIVTPKTEADKARAWLASLDLDNMQENDISETELYKYHVSVFRGKFCFYLTTKSPQQKVWRRSSIGTAWARGDQQAVRDGMDRFVNQMENKATRRNAKTEAKRQARAAFVNPYKVGDFLNSSWGYDQTNKEFYQIVEVKGLTLKIREVAQNRTETGYMCGNCTPIRNKFIGGEKTAVIQVNENGHHWINSPIHGHLYEWDGKPEYYSSYA